MTHDETKSGLSLENTSVTWSDTCTRNCSSASAGPELVLHILEMKVLNDDGELLHSVRCFDCADTIPLVPLFAGENTCEGVKEESLSQQRSASMLR